MKRPLQDSEYIALENAIRSLQSEKATARCHRVVVDRLADLSPERRTEVQKVLRGVTVPGFRPGKATSDSVLQYAQRRRRLDHYLFHTTFPIWVELLAGFPEEVAAVVGSTLPELDTTLAEWPSIVMGISSIATRVAHRSRQDILLALFQRRFGSLFQGLLDDAPAPHDLENGDAADDNVNGLDFDASKQSLPAAAALPPKAGTIVDDLSVLRAPGADSPSATLRAFVDSVRSLPASSAIWDLIPDLIAEIGEIRASKLEERASLEVRDAVVAALSALQSQECLLELGFLRIDECHAWTVSGEQSTAAATTEKLYSLVDTIKSHREARLGAQKADDDSELERHTAARQRAKRLILEVIADLDPKLRQMELAPAIAVAQPDAEQADAVARSTAHSLAAPTEVDCDRNMSDVDRATNVVTLPLPLSNKDLALQGAWPDDRTVRAQEPTSAVGTAQHDPDRVVPAGATAEWDVSAPLTIEAPRGPERSVSFFLELPEELTSYSKFREHYWLGPSGVEPAPWREEAFGEVLVRATMSWLSKGATRTWALLTLARALEALGRPPVIAANDVRSAAELWSSPELATAGLDSERSERLRAGAVATGTPGQRVALTLEALRPSLERPVLAHEIGILLEQAQFDSGALRVAVNWLLTARAHGHDPIELVRLSRRTTPRPTGDLEGDLAAARRELQSMVTRLWSAAGGKVQRTHCRQAWSDFVEQIQPSLDQLYPPPRGNDLWTPIAAGQEIDGYVKILDATCERHEAKFDDKRRMVRTATEIADAARRVVERRRDILHAADVERPSISIPNIEIAHLRTSTCECSDEEYARQLLVRVLDADAAAQTSIHPLAITIDDLCYWPSLLRVVRDVPRESVNALRARGHAFAYADDLDEPVRAAAVIVQPADTSDTVGLEALVSKLERTQRSALLGQLIHALDDKQQRRVHGERTDSLGRLSSILSQISQVVDDLAQLGNRFALALRDVRNHARSLIETDDVRLDTTLIERWLERVLSHGRELMAEHVVSLSHEAERRDDGADIQAALARRDYGRAVRLLRGHPGTELRATRQTEWRDSAEANREAQLRTLYAAPDPKLKSLVDAWRVGVKGDVTRNDRTLRTEFARVLTDGRDLSRESTATYVAFPMSAVLEQLSRDQLMPTWMPQLSRFSRLVLLTPPVSPEQASFRQATLSLAANYAQDLAIFLMPRLPSTRRIELLAELRRRGNAAVVDDVDVLRLLNPGGQRPHQLLGLLEIALEQQRRAVFSPFELPEGSLVKLEMYVGRRDQARELARTANYSRLFSGRKLGKSALLRCMERTESGVKLPSGNILRVVYVPAAGIESESAMVDTIHASVEATLGEKLPLPTVREPAERLGQLLSEYLAAHRRDSLLLVLDEADVFFERQLAEYEEHREKCLSFQMRSRFTAATDEHGLPRVRFVFAGYRVTNRSQGAWANWGRVLSLDPLEPDDATRLIAAPLAVMGIDLGSHAHEVAYRCGYQPAILLRFGERLMDHLDRQPYRPSERYVVSQADLSQVFDDQRVHEEIRTIARNNFEGNPAGLIVFGALLREILELPPGQALIDAAERIADRLRSIDADLDWLEREGDAFDAIRGFLSDFVERNLLRQRPVGGDQAYTLRFPHHMTILSSLAEVSRMREEVKRLRARSAGAPADQAERALVTARALRDLAEATQPKSDAIAVVGTLWPSGAYDHSGGIPDRLGATSDETVDAHTILDGQRAVATVRAIRRADPASADYLLAELRAAETRPVLIGGADLYRWALAQRRTAMNEIFEVHGVGRLSPARLTWWFQRNRAFEFVRSDAIAAIFERTGGIPFLVELVDGQLRNAAGSTLSAEKVSLALDAVDEALPRLAQDLLGGRPAIRLEHREREILEMISHVVTVDPSMGQEVGSALTELWELFADACKTTPLGPSDSIAMDLLLDLGLLPSKGSAAGSPHERIGPIDQNDPVLKLVRLFGRRDVEAS